MDKDSIPSFFIIGVQKSATSFMHSLLKQDMKISLPYRKETHFFSLNFDKKINWYLNMFHSKKYDIRGEVDPSYIHYPKSLENIKITTKDPKFIIIFRKPIDRAYSQYLMSKKRNYDKLTFNNALHEEKQRLLNDKNLFSFSNHSYMARGNYREQIIRCKKIFPKAGEELVKRIFLITTIGPLYAWYVMAKTVIKYTPEPKDSPPKHGSVKYLAWKVK